MWEHNEVKPPKPDLENITSIKMKEVHRELQTLINDARKLLLSRDKFHTLLEPFEASPINFAVGSGSNFKIPLKGSKMPLRLNFKYEVIEQGDN